MTLRPSGFHKLHYLHDNHKQTNTLGVLLLVFCFPNTVHEMEGL